uniref:Helitron helicase n=2 Tax=Bursaphelenchus xylophilus TaxID=6326 RepID=A0A1I7RQG3_BURXY
MSTSEEASSTAASTSESSTVDSRRSQRAAPAKPSRVKTQPEVLKAEAKRSEARAKRKKERREREERRSERKEEKEREERRLERRSRKEREKRRDEEKEKSRKRSSTPIRSKKSNDPNRCRPTDTSKRCLRQYYAGVRTSEEMNRKVRRSQFRLYYKIDPDVDMTREMQFSIPLFVAYKDSERNMYHFPVIATEHERYGRKWSIGLPGEDRRASFSNLPKLLDYYEVYNFVHPDNGSIEVFPVWLVHESQKD